MSTRAVWRRSEEVAHVESPGRVALLHLGHLDRPPMILEGSSAVIWELLDGSRDEDALVDAVAEHYGLSVPEVEQPVALFLEELSGLEVIEAQ